MREMINGLLEYARLTSKPLEREIVNMNDVFSGVKESLVHSLHKKDASITINAPNEVVWGSKTQLNQLFQNLVGNALKFCDKSKPIIKISSKNKMKISYLR